MSDDHASPPGLPEIHDEAADTPMWVPLLGLSLLVLATLYLVITSAFEEAEVDNAEEPPVAAAAAEAEPALE